MSDLGDRLPAGWAWATIGDLTTLVTSGSRGWAQHYSPDGAVFLRVGNLDRNTVALDLSELAHVRPPRDAEGTRTRVRANDVLLSITADVGMVGLVPAGLGEAYINQHVALLRPVEGIDARYFAWALTDPHGFQGLVRDAKYGVTKASVSLDQVRRFRLAVPPRTEQHRLVAKIEALQHRSDAVEKTLDAIPPLLEQFRQSVLAAAFRGDLTRDWWTKHPDVEPASKFLMRIRAERRRRWIEDRVEKVSKREQANAKLAGNRGIKSAYTTALERARIKVAESYKVPEPVDTQNLPILPPGWCWASIGEISASLSYGTATKSADTGRVPVLRMGNIQDGEIDWTDLKFTDDVRDIAQYQLAPGTVIFNRTNSPELVGKTAIYRGQRPALYAGYLIRIVPGDLVLPDYLNLFLNSPWGRAWSWRAKTDGVSQSNISGSALSTCPVPVCDLAQQERIVAAVRARLQASSRLAETSNHARRRTTRLNQSILSKAFRGELVS